MRNLNYDLKQLCQRNRDGSYTTQDARERGLSLIAAQLYGMGYLHMTVHSLKPKHVTSLVELWHRDGKEPGTMKNLMSFVRWWAEKIGKPSIVARSNAAYGIAERSYVSNISKGRLLTTAELDKVTDPYTSLSLQLQAAFGLRREESIKFIAAYADHGDTLVLKGSWCKGGREREIPITTEGQRHLLDAVHAQCGQGSLIPAQMSYIEQLERFKYQCGKAGIDNVHGHRHAYAQLRYLLLAGWECPACGGPTSKHLTPLQKEVDQSVRLQISRELGHEREQITAVYLGR